MHSEEILRQVVGLHIAIDVWDILKNTFNKASMDRELTLNLHLEMLRRESCDSLSLPQQIQDYLR